MLERAWARASWVEGDLVGINSTVLAILGSYLACSDTISLVDSLGYFL